MKQIEACLIRCVRHFLGLCFFRLCCRSSRQGPIYPALAGLWQAIALNVRLAFGRRETGNTRDFLLRYTISSMYLNASCSELSVTKRPYR